MSDLDFYNYFHQQTERAYGDMSGDYPTAPISSSQTVEELIKSGNPLTSETTSAEGLEPSNPVQLSDTRASMGAEWYSLCRPLGDVPEGYALSECCGTCTYGEMGYCYRYDFPCHASYVCSGYESAREELEEMTEHIFSENCLHMQLSELSDEELEILAEGWTKGGNVKSDTREKKAVLSKGRFPVFDKKSATSALKLRGKAKTSKERNRIISAAAKYAPEAAKKAREEDNKNEKLSALYSHKTPTKPALFSLVCASADVDAEETTQIFSLYESLFIERYGTDIAMYVEDRDSASSEEASISESSESLSDSDLSATVTSYSSAGSPAPTKRNLTLYQVAESRIQAKAKQDGTTYSSADVEQEYERLVAMRSGNTF